MILLYEDDSQKTEKGRKKQARAGWRIASVLECNRMVFTYTQPTKKVAPKR